MNNKKSSQGGFIRLIILIVIVFLTMRYYHLTFSGIWDSILLYIKKFPLLDQLVHEIIKGFHAVLDSIKNTSLPK
jgi:hypothetical protein